MTNRPPHSSSWAMLVLFGLLSNVQRRKYCTSDIGASLFASAEGGDPSTFSPALSSLSPPPVLAPIGGIGVAPPTNYPSPDIAIDIILTPTQPPPTSSISGHVFFDSNGDGTRDITTSAGIYNTSVSLFDCTHEIIDTTKTDTLGYYSFEELHAGRCYISLAPPRWYAFSDAWNGETDETGTLLHPGADSSANPETGRTECFALEEGEDKVVSFGMKLDASLNSVPATSAPSNAPAAAVTSSPTASPSKYVKFTSLEPAPSGPSDRPIGPSSQLPSGPYTPSLLNNSTSLGASSSLSVTSSHPPSQNPTKSSHLDSIAPPSRPGILRGPTVKERLVMTIHGIETLENEEAWSAATSEYIMEFFNLTNTDLGAFDVTASIVVTRQTSNGNDTLFERYVEVTYDQTSRYKTSNPAQYDDVYVAMAPFSLRGGSEEYVTALWNLSPYYNDAWSVGLMHMNHEGLRKPPSEINEENVNRSLFIVVGVIFAGIIVRSLAIRMIRSREKCGEEFSEDVYEGVMYSHRRPDRRRFDDDLEVGHPTIISTERRPPFPNDCSRLSNPTSDVNAIHVMVPPGKLGVVFEAPPADGSTSILETEGTSPIIGQIHLGDKIVAVNDEGAQMMSVVDVCKRSNSETIQLRRT